MAAGIERGARAVEAALAAIEKRNDDLAAFVIIDGKRARAEAAHQAAVGCSGPLAGLPVAIKDIIDVAGHPTRAGSLTRKDAAPAKADATCVARLKAAGAIVVGKTNTVEYAFGGWGTNHAVGTPRNPWDRSVHRTPGGSSSGSGAAVGGGLVPAALGSDTGGSVRIPASLCGCVGLKTSIGLVSRAGVVPLSQTFDTIGPMARSVRLAAEMLAVMQGPDPADASTLGHAARDPLRDLDRGIAGLRIGRLSGAALSAVTPDVRAAFHAAIMTLAKAGATVAPVELPQSVEEYMRRSGILIAAEAYANWQGLADDEASALHPLIRKRMLAARKTTGLDLIKSERQRQADIAQALGAIDRLDAVILPTTPITAIPIAEVDEGKTTMATHTRVVNYLEMCALSVPMGLSPEGLPMGLQIVARRFDEPLALRIGQAYEATRGPWKVPG